MRYRFPQGTPGRRLLIIGIAVWIPAYLLIFSLVLSYGHAFLVAMTIGTVAFAVGAPCSVLGVLRMSRYRRSQTLQSTEHLDRL
jgi:hypothetical protein